MANKRTYWAIEALGFATFPNGQPTVDATTENIEYVPGVQSVGISTNYNLEQTFQLGQLEVYQDVEEVPDVEVTIERVLDQYTAAYARAMDNAAAGKVTITGDQNNQVDVYFSVNADTDEAAGDDVPDTIAYMSGMYCSSASFNFATDGNFTESITLVGNHQTWHDAPGLRIQNSPYATGVGDLMTGNITRRNRFAFETGGVPTEISSLTIAGGIATELAVQNVSVSVDFGREAINILGMKVPYHRYVTFPVEVTTDIEALVTDVAKMNNQAAQPEIDNLAERTIKFSIYDTAVVDQDTGAGNRLHTFDLGTKNKITSITWNGLDTGGTNASITYSYRNFNKLDYIFASADGSAAGTVVLNDQYGS